MPLIDLTTPERTFDVPTVRVEGPNHYMGDDVRVHARDAEHAKEVVRKAGYTTNRYFEPTEVKKRR